MRPLLVLAATSALLACGSPRRGIPLIGAREPTSPQLLEGRRVFDRYCHQCHPGGAGGVGPALTNKPLPETLVRKQIRVALGAMPSFSEAHLSDEQVESVALYVDWLSKLPAPEE